LLVVIVALIATSVPAKDCPPVQPGVRAATFATKAGAAIAGTLILKTGCKYSITGQEGTFDYDDDDGQSLLTFTPAVPWGETACFETDDDGNRYIRFGDRESGTILTLTCEEKSKCFSFCPLWPICK
jgi:hypothetical protein